MNSPLISVLVPVYKVEAYLQRCIDSVLAQDFEDWEMILVDDGSPDKCPEICDEAAKKDDRIRVVHKENGGLPSARLAGFEQARGEYLVFLDSDDYLLPHALRILYDQISLGYDIVRGSILRENNISGEQWKESYEIETGTIENPNDFLEALILQKIPPYLHSGIYRKTLFDNTPFDILIRHKINVGEDWLTNIYVGKRVKRYLSIDVPVVAYCINQNSFMNSSISTMGDFHKSYNLLAEVAAGVSESVFHLLYRNRIIGCLYNEFIPELSFNLQYYRIFRKYISEDTKYEDLQATVNPHYRFFCCFNDLFFSHAYSVRPSADSSSEAEI